jgi:hypothetical protein
MRKALILLASSCVALGMVQNSSATDATPVPESTPAATSSTAGVAAPAAHTPAPSAPAAAQTKVAEATTAGAKPAGAEAEGVADDPVICRTEYQTGSRVRKNKICMTQSQWEAHTQAARRFMHGIDQSRAVIQPGAGG